MNRVHQFFTGMKKAGRSLECVLLLVLLNVPSSQAAKGMPAGWDAILLKVMLIKIIDGDTFDANLDRNRRTSRKEEQIRLLYVDTPELSDSHKGKNLYHGKPATVEVVEH